MIQVRIFRPWFALVLTLSSSGSRAAWAHVGTYPREGEFRPIVRNHLRVTARQIFWNGSCVRELSAPANRPVEREIILHLSARPDRIVPRGEVRDHIIACGLGGLISLDENLNQRIARLRRAFKRADETFAALETINRVGLRWHDPVGAEMESTNYLPAPVVLEGATPISGRLVLDTERGVLTLDGLPVDLNPYELRALVALAQAFPGYLSPGRLADAMGCAATGENAALKLTYNVRVRVARLRAFLERINADVSIATVHGYGYQLMRR